MATGRGSRLLRSRREVPQATFLELFFDLAFVFALTRLSQELIQNLSWGGGYRTLIMLMAIWWLWSSTAWMTNRFDPDRPAIQIVVITIMLGALIMAVAVPGAFGDRGAMFAIAYVAVQLGRSLFFLVALRGRGHRHGRPRRRGRRLRADLAHPSAPAQDTASP